jgi:hypothetical protein
MNVDAIMSNARISPSLLYRPLLSTSPATVAAQWDSDPLS